MICRNILARMEATSRKDFAYAMTPLKVLTWPVGTWPLQDYNIFASVRAYTAIASQILMITVIYMEISIDNEEAEKNLNALCLATCGTLAIAKVSQFYIRPDGLISNFTSALKDYNELRNEERRAILRRHAYMSRVTCASVIGFTYSFFCATLYTFVTMLFQKRDALANVTEVPEFPFPSQYVLESMEVPKNLYSVIIVLEYVILVLTSNGNLGNDLMFLGIVFHLCGQVEVLKMEIIGLTDGNEKTTKNFKAIIKRHIHLLKLANMLIETVSSILVLQLFSSCLLISISGFQLILALSVGNVILSLSTFMVMMIVLVQLFVYSYVGNYLKQQMESIGNSLYFSYWYDLPQEVAKNMIYVIMRTQDPVQLKAGNFFIVNIETYMSIVKTSMSYLSVLRVMVNS